MQSRQDAITRVETRFALAGTRAATRQIKALARGCLRHRGKILLDAEFRLRLIRVEVERTGQQPWWAGGLYMENLRASAIASRYARRYRDGASQ